MRLKFAAFLVVLACLGSFAAAQTVALHQTGSAAPPAASPKPAASAIIPGSPLAALTGAGAPTANSEAATPAPFGTTGIGFSVTTTLGKDLARSFGDFAAALHRSTRLAPVVDWLKSFKTVSYRRHDLVAIVIALAMSLLPGLAVEAAIRLGLARLRHGLIRRAAAAPAESDTGAAAAANLRRRRATLHAWFRRLLFALMHFLAEIAALVGFALTVQMLLSTGLITERPARLASIGIANVYLACRLAMEIIRFLVLPGGPSLRLIAMPDRRAGRILGWTKLLLATGLLGYALISISEILGLPRDGAIVLTRLIVLAGHIEVALCIWQSRRVVGAWIAGRPDAPGFFASLRRRFGASWHYFALFYVLALWIAWAGGVRHAFAVLLRVVAVFVAALILGRMAWHASSLALDRAFPDPASGTTRHPALLARAHAYNPLVRGLIRAVIIAGVAAVILQGWGVDAFAWLMKDPLSRSLIGALVAIVITIAVALAVWEIANALLNGRIDRLSAAGRTRQAMRLRTLMPMLKATIGAVIVLAAGLICLSKIGVNAGPLLAGAGVVGIAVGFGSQKLVQDIITGLFLLLEDAMQVGDVVTLAGMSGTVERLSIRAIRLRGGDGSINIIPFSAVTTVTNMTRDFGYAQISIQVGYDEDLTKVNAVLRDIAQTMREEPVWKPMIRDDLQIFGLDEFGASALVITGQIRTGPGQHWAVRREFYARVKARFAAEHIRMPYTYQPTAEDFRSVLELPGAGVETAEGE